MRKWGGKSSSSKWNSNRKKQARSENVPARSTTEFVLMNHSSQKHDGLKFQSSRFWIKSLQNMLKGVSQVMQATLANLREVKYDEH